MGFTTMARGEVTGKKPAQTADEAKRLPGPPITDVLVTELSAESDDDAAITPLNTAAIEATGKSEPDSPAQAKATPIRGPPVPAAWYSLREFAAAHRLSMAMLYKLKAQGRGPRETAVGSRRFITFEDAAAWRAAQKEATAA